MTIARTTPAARPLRGRVAVPADKAISHRAALIGAMADGVTRIVGFATAADCRSTLGALRTLGVDVRQAGGAVAISGRAGFDAPSIPVDCGRSGTTMRLLAGMLAADRGPFTLTGDDQLLRRPMERVAGPLRAMGGDVQTAEGGRPPVTISGGELLGIAYELPVASAQVKSAVLLAGTRARGPSAVVEPAPTRDHTERLLGAAGVAVERARTRGGVRVTVAPGRPRALDVRVPGDVSSAAFLMAAAALVPGSDLRLDGVGLNPTRTGFIELLRRMGGSVDVERFEQGMEPSGELRVRHAALRGVRVGAKEVPRLIDELPLVGLLATQAEGTTEVTGAEELRVKESDRIEGLTAGLRLLGANVEELPDGFVVRGPTPLIGGSCDGRSDHRLAMTFAVAGLVAADPVEVSGIEFVDDSFPGFASALAAVR